MLTFGGIGSSSVDTGTSFTFGSLGLIHTATTGTGATITNPTTLTINISQTIPCPTTCGGSLGGTLTGTISQSSSNAVVTFTVNSVMIAGITYSIANNPLALVPPSTNNGYTTIQARIDGAVPEPMTSVLIGFGLVGLASLQRLRQA